MASSRHWVEDLFQPAFGFTFDELVKHKLSDDTVEPKVNRVSLYDTEAIRNVYERVRVMVNYEQELKNQKEAREQKSDGDVLQADLDKKQTEVSLSDIPDSRMDELSLWNSEETEILVEVFKTAKSKNVEMEIKVKETEKHNKLLEDKVIKLNKDFDKANAKLSDAKKANNRLQLLSENMKSELDRCQAQVSTLHAMLQEVKDDKGKLTDEHHQNKVHLDAERLERHRLADKLSRKDQEHCQEMMLCEDKLRMAFSNDISLLEQKVDELTKDLDKEQQVHAVTRRGLRHLQKHFASLSVSSAITNLNSVVQDQVTDISY